MEIEKARLEADRLDKIEIEKARVEMEKAKMEEERVRAEKDRHDLLVREEANRKLQYDLEKLRLDAETKRQANTINTHVNPINIQTSPTDTQASSINTNNDTPVHRNENDNSHWLNKKMQPFKEATDSISDYLKRFEIKLTNCNVRESEWSQILLDLVQGQALTICQNHDHTIQDSYQILKKELLNAYGHNASTFRTKYYENTPSNQVEPQTTINLEKDYFSKWLGFEEIENTFEGLRNFILIDNFINKCH
uniref:Uncharacterized protein n=1 Tax=Biomphalaria glabrata TaxID=6526 RepID=A0A2C9KV64_BIOGL